LLAAFVLFVVSLPLLLCGMLLVKLTSRGPALYRQVRVGLDGREFALFKLRTMKHNAEAETGPVWSTGNDSRVTTLGKILRKTHIDEFPQLWNVIRGEMSLIGPRPERPEFVARLDWAVPFYRERLNVRPGITGLAQLRLPPDSDVESVKRKVAHDVYYVQHVNPALDGKLLLLTAWRLLLEIYDSCRKAANLPRSEEVEQVFRRTVGGVQDAAPVTLTSLSAQCETKVDIPEYRA
jgi:lipopolysaccharide/colanic/teichoic acid biosynthesis glycosyltransferase